MTTLFVDLDRTLIKSDYLLESFVKYCSQNIFAPLVSAYIFLSKGRAGLKRFLYEKTNISIIHLPYDKQVIDLIYRWKKEHPTKKVYLVSASYHQAVGRIAEHLKIFDGWYGTEHENLKSEIKLKKIFEITAGQDFEYIGDSFADVVIWRKAKKCYLVNASRRLIKTVSSTGNYAEVVGVKEKFFFQEIIKTMRVYQWVKNLLIFIPTILSFDQFARLSESLVSGFFAFSFVASAFYIVNDLFDIESDRNHYSKKYRSFAAGSLSVTHGFYIFIFLIVGAFIIASNLSPTFQLLLLFYSIGTFTYSKYLKKKPILDIMALSLLYLSRLIAGGVLVDVPVSNWLLSFAVFFFLFLAGVKRWIELKRISSEAVSGRGYENSDMQFICNISYFSGLISVLVICLYIESQQALNLYKEPRLLWFIPIILLYWILETLLIVQRGQMDDDPVKYALKSKTSYIALFGFIIILMLSAT